MIFCNKKDDRLSSGFNIILKISDSCPLNCDYCYYFRNEVSLHKRRPLKISIKTVEMVCKRINEYSTFADIDKIFFSLHGGEPLAVGKRHFCKICDTLKENLIVPYKLLLQSNGVLVDEEWINIMKRYDVQLGISIDGPEKYQNVHRKLKNGKGSYKIVNNNILKCISNGLKPGVLLVIDPSFCQEEVFNYIVNDLSIDGMDILVRDYTIDTIPSKQYVEEVCSCLNQWLDLWLNYPNSNLHIRLFDSMLQVLKGNESCLEFGFKNNASFVPTVTIYTDGEVSPPDELSSISNDFMDIGKNVYQDSFKDIFKLKKFKQIQVACEQVSEECKKCYLQNVCCGGAGLLERYSSQRGFKNKGAYCEVWKSLFTKLIEKLLSSGYPKDELISTLQRKGL